MGQLSGGSDGNTDGEIPENVENANTQMMYWLTGGDITRYQAIRRQPLRLAIKWLICRFKEIDDERGFIAACHGAKLKERSGNNRGGLRGLLGMMQSVSKGSAMLQVERVRVSPEELRRRGDKNKGREI